MIPGAHLCHQALSITRWVTKRNEEGARKALAAVCPQPQATHKAGRPCGACAAALSCWPREGEGGLSPMQREVCLAKAQGFSSFKTHPPTHPAQSIGHTTHLPTHPQSSVRDAQEGQAEAGAKGKSREASKQRSIHPAHSSAIQAAQAASPPPPPPPLPTHRGRTRDESI